MHKVILVDKEDNIIGYKSRNELRDTDLHRIAALWVENEEDEVLIAKRSEKKKIHPNLWGPAAAGTIEEDETYESNIIKEAEEEIGLKNIRPIPIKKMLLHNDQRMCQWFKIVIPTTPISAFVLKEDEVAEVHWVKKDVLAKCIRENPEAYGPSMQEALTIFLENY
jgi:isopentenyldiphosphate isomerase